jgi:hypothetical protein
MKDRTQELRSVSLGWGRWGGGTPVFGERVGTGCGDCGDVGVNDQMGLGAGAPQYLEAPDVSSEPAFWGSDWKGLEAIKTEGGGRGLRAWTPHVSRRALGSNLGIGRVNVKAGSGVPSPPEQIFPN